MRGRKLTVVLRSSLVCLQRLIIVRKCGWEGDVGRGGERCAKAMWHRRRGGDHTYRMRFGSQIHHPLATSDRRPCGGEGGGRRKQYRTAPFYTHTSVYPRPPSIHPKPRPLPNPRTATSTASHTHTGNLPYPASSEQSLLNTRALSLVVTSNVDAMRTWMCTAI